MDKYNLIIDDTNCDLELIWQLFDIRKEMPEAFYERMQKMSIYFMFPYSIWSKSRTVRNINAYENIVSDVNRLEDNNCSIFFEFENVYVNNNDFHDRYTNLVLSIVKDKEVHAVVFDEELAKFIKEKYPNIKLVQSEIKRNVFFEEPFEMGIIDYISYKNNKDKLPNKDLYIVSVNSFCKNLYRCVNSASNNKLNYGTEKFVGCEEKLKTFDEMKKNDLFISIEEMNKINDDGIQNFLVKSNCDDRYEILETYLYYLIKPEFIDTVRLRMIKSCFVKR